jgi:hypothetical protein
MMRSAWIKLVVVTMCATIVLVSTAAQAGTILKLGLGNDTPGDIEFTGGAAGVMSTVDDGDAATTGEQNTNIDYTSFLDGSFTDVLTSTASFTMDGLVAAGAPTVHLGGPLVVQNFTGGTFNLYDAGNTLLLSGTLSNSAITGPIGPPATGGLMTSTFATITGGTLQPLLQPGSLTLAMGMVDINDGAGLSMSSGAAPTLNPFTADVVMAVDAEPIPEPAAMVLLAIAVGMGVAGLRGHRVA